MAGTNYPDFYEAITNTSTLTLDTLILNNKVITAIENIPMGNANNDILIWDFTNQQWIPSATYFGRGHLIDGTEIAPALAFNSNTNTGIYKVGNNIIGFSCNGVQQMRLTTTEAVFNQNIEVNNILSTLARGIVIGQKTPDRNNVYIGWNAGQNIASTQLGNVFIGERAGSHSTTPNTLSQHNIAIGYGAGMDNNGTTGNISIGYGTVGRGSSTIIIGSNGHSNTTNNSIMLNASGAITYSPTNGSFVVRPIRNVTQTGGILQYNTSNFEVTYHRDIDVNIITMNQITFTGNALRIGQNAVTTSNSISIGIWAGGATTTSNNINIGFYAGFFTGTGTQLGGGNINIGYQAGNLTALNVNNSVSLGNQSKANANNVVCIGNSAVSNNVNCIVLNASGISTSSPQSDSLIIRPIRNTNSNSILQYNPTTFEVTHSTTLPSFTTTNATINGVLTIPSLTGNKIVLTDASDNLISSSFTDTDFARVGASNTFTQSNIFSNVTINGTTTISNLNPNKIVLTDASDNLISSSFTDTDFARVGASNTFTQSNTFSNVTINGTTTISNLNPNKIVLTDASDNLISSSFTDTDFARVGASNTFTQNNIFSSPITLLLGTVGNPSINFSGDTNTGIYSSGADIVNIVTGGTSRMQITNTGTTINNLTTTGVTSSGNISIISPSGNSEILILTQNNLTSRLSLKEFSTSYGMELIYNGTDNAFYIDALNVTRTTIFSTNVVTYNSTFFRPVYFENNIFFPNTSTISISGLSQPTNSVINPQFTFLHPITKIDRRTGLSYNDVAGASPSLVLVADGSAILQAGVDTGVTALLQIRGTKHATIPTYSFRDDTNTGITSDSADSLKIMCGGVTNAIFDTGDITFLANDINLQTSYLSFGTSGQLFLTYNTVPGSGYDALNFYCQSKLRFQIVDNTSNIQECRFMGVTAQGASYLSIIYWSDAHVYYRNSRNANDPTPKRHIFQGYDYQGLKSSFITPGTTSWQTTFTGQHICAFENMAQINVGYIVVSTGKISSFIDNKDGHLETKTGKDGVIIDEALPIVTYSSKMNQKSVFGVVCSVEAEDAETRDMGFDVMTSYSKDKNDRRVIINSIGEGAIWVCNSNGNLENGDYITSSIIRGIGCKQHDDVLHNYTVSKITIDCNFDDSNAYEIKYIDINDIEMTKEEYEIKKQTETLYIKAFLPCTYHCG